MSPSYATTQQAAVSDALTQAGVYWFVSLINVTANAGHGVALSDQSNALHTISNNYSQPYVYGVCHHEEIGNTSDYKKIQIPLLPQVNSPAMATSNTTDRWLSYIDHHSLTYTQLWDTPGNLDGYRLRWIELPAKSFPGSSIGAVVLLPGPRERKDFMGYNFAATWGSSSLGVEAFGGGIGRMESTYDGERRASGPGVPISQSHVPSAKTYSALAPNPFQSSSLSYQNAHRSINISNSWAQYLNPTVEGLNTSLLNVLMRYSEERLGNVQTLLVMLMANGLARTGSGSSLQGELKTVELKGGESLDGNHWISGKGDVFTVDSVASQDWVTFRMDSELEGYAYNTLTTPPRIAIAVLTAYCLLVVGHTIYAGISELHISKLPVRVLVNKDEEGEGDDLELVFGRMQERREIEERTIKANRTYGTMPGSFVAESKKEV
ncbi:MAG: hypothetical protein Q9169_004152 [Polycauliona sp. 2 TL-2023]